jgi:hypothetical protein
VDLGVLKKIILNDYNKDRKKVITLNSVILTQLSTPTSNISKILPSYILTKVSPCGLFFVVWPITNNDASFLDAQNSRDAVELDSELNGRMSFFLLNAIA